MTHIQTVLELIQRAREDFSILEHLLAQCRAANTFSQARADEIAATAQELAETMRAFNALGETDCICLRVTAEVARKTQPRACNAQESLLPEPPATLNKVENDSQAKAAERKLLSNAAIRLWNLYVKTHSKQSALRTKQRILLLVKWLKLYSEEQLSHAILGCALSPHHMGIRDDGSAGPLYNSLELILRDPKHIEQFIEIYDRHQSSKEQSSPKEARQRRPRLPMNPDCPVCAKFRRVNNTEQPSEICPDCWEDK